MCWVILDLFATDWQQPDVKDVDQQVAKLLHELEEAPTVELDTVDGHSRPSKSNCTHYNCFDIYRCGNHPKKMLIHIPTPMTFTHDHKRVTPMSKDFVDILEAVVRSGYYTPDPEQACVFLPALDLLSEQGLDSKTVYAALSRSSDHWNDGRNHLIFTPYPRNAPGLDLGSAMLAKAGLDGYTFRPDFDIALPSYSQKQELSEPSTSLSGRKFLVLMAQNLPTPEEILNVPNLYVSTELSMREAVYCLVLDLHLDSGRILSEILHHGCVPIIASDLSVLPFSSVLDWKAFSIRIYRHDLAKVMDIVMDVSEVRLQELQRQIHFVYQRYFANWKAIVQTTLDILNDRIVPHHAKTYRDWNLRHLDRNPLFMPNANPSEGFTAVILTYDRVESLFNVITKIADTPSLSRIVVVWNNQEKPPPVASEWPKISKTLKVIKTRANVLSNRFYPYEEIATEAVLSLDDDIMMLTADELELGYQVWREFPDRLVGFPSRTHVWETDKFKYESEWTSEISMVLTGASFYHKYWHYLYTAAPNRAAQEIKQWVDKKMNCEDIAMNFLVANATGHPPIKVAPRKKFKCSTAQCLNQELSLSGQHNHMVARSECINLFAEKYGYLPLKHVEFRVDPVLYKDQIPDKLKKFVNVGSL